MKLKQFIIESSTITHLTHLEDLILNGKLTEFKDIVDKITSTEVEITLKIDGSPSIFVGRDTDGKIFVATKSIFNKTPRLYKTSTDLKDISSNELTHKLDMALSYLSLLDIPSLTVYQGDFLFIDSDLKKQTINNKDYIIFTPNTITYAISSDMPIYKKILHAKVGIFFHTVYSLKRNNEQFELTKVSGDKLKIFGTKIEDDPNIFTLYPTLLNTKLKFTNKPEIFKILDTIRDVTFINKLKKDYPSLFNIVSMAVNAQLDRDDDGIFGRVKDDKDIRPDLFIDDLNSYITTYLDREKEKLKTEKGKKSKDKLKEIYLNYLKLNNVNLKTFILSYGKAIKIKYLILKNFNNIDMGLGYTFIKTKSDKYIQTTDEGFVVNTTSGIIKLIDRTEFSKYNRLYSRNK